ncbi:MAG: hypothetical protein OXE52_05580 [Chloroflexi bacterium]|nr:hypothetical protein [Chloroflexota bacterium]
MESVTPRKAIIERRDEANSCIRYGLYTAAALTACSGVELLLESLFTEYYISILRDDRNSAREFLAARDQWNEEHDLKNQWTLTNWRRYFNDAEIPRKMQARFGKTINILSPNMLREINTEWNKCKHEIHVASPKTAIHIVEILNSSLEELDYLAGEGINKHASVVQLNTDWQSHWGDQILDWTTQNRDSPFYELLSRLTSLLNLVVNLASDPRIDFELKIHLLVAAHYVYSAMDLIPDIEHNVNTLVDDGAVLVLTMSWLMQHDNIHSELINEHWSGKDDASQEIQRLEQYIRDNHHVLFPDNRRSTGGSIVWSTIRRVAKVGPEALWQNYWKEAY